MASLEQRLEILEREAAPVVPRVVVYEPGEELSELPAGAEVVILLPDNGRGDQDATHV